MYSFINKELENEYTSKTISENYNKILLTMLPIIPHFASECLERINLKLLIIGQILMKNCLLIMKRKL